VKSTRGSLTVAVEEDVARNCEGTAYRIVLEPSDTPAAAQGPRGTGGRNSGGRRSKPARSRFIWYAIGVTTLLTVWAFTKPSKAPTARKQPTSSILFGIDLDRLY